MKKTNIAAKHPTLKTSLKALLLVSVAAGGAYTAPALANGGVTPDFYPNADLINEGRDLFFNETFNGNGRTCGSCHAEDNNFTIDARSIAKLPADDPLFAAERGGDNPLADNFEIPELMHSLGLIRENTNGFGDLDNNFTMRAVNHTLALRTTRTPPSDNANDGTSNPPDERTGWSGDGSPVNLDRTPQLRGTMRDFAQGAITQHFTKRPERVEGEDFRLATEHELDAIIAFMFSLGRQEEFDSFNEIKMTNPVADQGRLNYMGVNVSGALNCNACHFNGGGNTNPDFDFASTGVSPAAFEATNRSFAPRAEELLDQPGDVQFDGETAPFDDGFGSGTNLFNVPPVIEAADTGPFFHANQIDTVEGMVSFYSSTRHLRNGDVLPPIVELNGSQVANVGAFVRILNADENARSAGDLIKRARDLTRRKDIKTNLYLAGTEIEDALQDLNGANLHFADAVPLFEKAARIIKKRHVSDRKMRRAMKLLQQAREAMIDRSGVQNPVPMVYIAGGQNGNGHGNGHHND